MKTCFKNYPNPWDLDATVSSCLNDKPIDRKNRGWSNLVNLAISLLPNLSLSEI